MTKKIILKLLFTKFLIYFSFPIWGSNFNFEEKVLLISDRNLYVCGENILFSATILVNGVKSNTDFSKVLYLEIITPEGESLSKAKYQIQNGNCFGQLNIPTNILSGNYYLRAYTKWMRNFSNNNYSYTLLKIINPHKNDLLSITTDKNVFIETSIDSVKNNLNFIEASIPKLIFNTRECVSIKMNLIGDHEKKVTNTIITVVPDNTVYNTIIQKNDSNYIINKEYSPEINGATLSGKVVSSNNNKPLSNIRINLSIIGENDISTQISDSTGRFIFGFLNLYGRKDVFLCAEQKNGEIPKLLIDNDFCNNKIELKSHPFILSEQEKKIAIKLTQNIQVDSLFNQYAPVKEDFLFSTTSFYGEPTKSIYLDNYIQLPSIEEYFNEFIGDVTIKKKSGKRYFKIIGSNSLIQTFDPLVMIDFVAIEDHEQLLKAPPQNISRIEIINKPYIKGNQTYGGIISFISKKNNFAGVELPSSGIFINYNFLNYFNISNKTTITNFPDTRNTLYWEQFLEKTPNYFTFTTGDTPGAYQIIIRTITNDGQIHSLTSKIIITNSNI